MIDKGFISVFILALFLTFSVMATAVYATSTDQQLNFLADWKIVDLTQPLTADMPIWPGDPNFEMTPWATYEKDQYYINKLSIGEHSGTHWGTPNTFIEGGRSAEMFTINELVVPAAVIDIRQKAEKDVDYRLSIDDVKNWEKQHGREIPAGSVVILFTGWQDKWHDSQAFLGIDDKEILHCSNSRTALKASNSAKYF
jgi:kynurenine formamidase